MADYTRQWLRDQLASQLRDRNLGAVEDDLIDLGVSKIGLVLASQFNEDTVINQVPGNPFDIPSGVNALRGISYKGNNGTYALRSIPQHMINTNARSGIPQTYAIKGNQIYFNPFTEGEFEFTFFTNIPLGPAADDTIEALQAYPYIFREAAISEGYAWKGDLERAVGYERKYLGGIQEINRISQRLRQADVPVQRAV